MKSKRRKDENQQFSKKVEESFILFYIQLYETFEWNKTVQVLIYIFGQCQFVTFLWNPIVNSNINNASDAFNYRIIIYSISRFDIILTQLFNFQDQLFLIPLCFILIFEFIPISLFYFFKDSGQLNDSTKIFNQKTKSVYFVICSLYSQIFNVYLFVPFTALCFYQIFHNISLYSFNQQIYNSLFCIITILLLIVSYVLRMILCLQTINMKLDPFRQLNLTFLDAFLYSISIIQQLTFAIFQVQLQGTMVQAIVIIFKSLLKIYQMMSLITCIHIVTISTFIINSYAILEAILMILQVQYSTERIINGQISLVLTPLISMILIQFYTAQENNLFDNITSVSDPEKIKYYFGRIINDSNSNISQIYLLQSQMLKQSKNKYPIKIDQVLPFEALAMDIFPQQIINKFHLKKLKKLLSLNQRSNKLNAIHYIAVLFQLGFHYLAYKQISMFFGIPNNNQTSSNQSVRVRTQSFEMQGHRSISYVDKQSSSKDSKSQDLSQKLQQIEMQKKKLLLMQKSIMSGIEKEKIIFLRQQIQSQLQFQFIQFNKIMTESTHIQLGVKLFLESESRNQSLKASVIKSLNKKLLFFQEFQTQKLISSQRLYQQSIKLSARFYKIEQALLQLYGTFPSQKIQSVITFFYAELLNNYVEAYRLKNYTSISDEKLLTMHKNFNTQFLSRSLIFLNVALDEENQQLLITKFSDNASKFFMQTQDDFKQIKTVEQLLPDGIIREHYLLVQRFMKNGQSKYFLKNSQSYFRVMNSIIKPCTLLFDIHFTASSQIRFYVFLQELINQSAFIFIDVNENIGGLTENLFDKLGYNQSCLEQIFLQDLSQIKLQQLFPECQVILQAKQGGIVVAEFVFPKQSFFNNLEKELIKHQTLTSNTFTKKSHLNETLTNVSQLNKYELVLTVNKYEIYEYFYYILEIKEVKVLSKSNDEFEFDEHIFEHSHISEQEASANSPRSLNIFNRFIVKDNVDFLELSANYVSQNLGHDIEKAHFKDDLQLVSPNFSMSYQFTPNTSQMLLRKQQDFFNKQYLDASQSFQESKSNQIYQNGELENIDSNIRIKIQSRIAKQELQEDQSQPSTHAGIKKAIFYKKYETIDFFIQYFFPKSLQLFLFFHALSLLLGLIFFIIVLIATTIDLGQFLEEIDMIQLHSAIMVPHDIQYGIRQTVVTYQAYQSAGAISKALYTNLSEPLIMSTNDAYVEFRDNTLAQLSNQNLQPFFKDQYLELVFMKSDATQVYSQNLTIREGLMTMIHYYYMFKLRFEARLSPANQTFQVFQFANVLNINFWLEDLTVQIWEYSKNRSINIKTKWNTYWIIFLVLTVVPLLISVLYFRLYKQKFDKYLSMFRYCTAHKVSRDIDRYKAMIKVLSVNSELVFNYNFDINQKEQSITIEKYKFDQEQQKAKEIKTQSQFKPLNYFFGVVVILIIWVIYLILSVIVNEQTGSYLDKYYYTADLYKQIQDMTYSSASLYRNRDFGLLWKNFTYLTTNDVDKLYQYLYLGLDNIDKFNTLCNTFNPNLYQTSSQFLDFFDTIQKKSVCDILGEAKIGFLLQYCNKSLEGTLQQGLLPTLNYMKKQIQTQMAINNFTKRVEYNLYENEGALVVMIAFQVMTKELKAGMVMILQNQLQVSNAISITYIICMIIVILYSFYHSQKKYIVDLFLARRFILLLPSITLFLDDQFERHMRILLAAQKA